MGGKTIKLKEEVHGSKSLLSGDATCRRVPLYMKKFTQTEIGKLSKLGSLMLEHRGKLIESCLCRHLLEFYVMLK